MDNDLANQEPANEPVSFDDSLADLGGEPRPDNPDPGALEGFKDRVARELEQVGGNVKQLRTFTECHLFTTLSTEEKRAMLQQLYHMEGYHKALETRIELWKLQALGLGTEQQGATHVMRGGALVDFKTGEPV